MTQNANIKPTLIHGCAIRVTRLNADGSHVVGAKAGYFTKKVVDLAYTMDITAGPVRQITSGCNDLIVNYREPDIFNRFDFTLNVGQKDPELEEILTAATLIMDASTVPVPKGVNFPVSGIMTPPQVALEIWSDLYENGVFEATPFRYAKSVFPQVRFRINDGQFQNDAKTEQYIGYSEPNATWASGPYSDSTDGAVAAMGGTLWSAAIAAGASPGYLTTT